MKVDSRLLSTPAEKFDFQALVGLLEQTHRQSQLQAIRAINRAMVARNWLFGWYIVEFEQKGVDRAEYGQKLIDRLAQTLRFRGSSATNLRKFREFYIATPIQQTLSVESSHGIRFSLFNPFLAGSVL